MGGDPFEMPPIRRSGRAEPAGPGGSPGGAERAWGPWVTFTGRVLAGPQTAQVERPSLAPVGVCALVLVLVLLAPVVLPLLPQVVLLVVVIAVLSRRLHLPGLPGLSRRPGTREPGSLTLMGFRVLAPGAQKRTWSCRLVTADVTNELSPGDTVTVDGRLASGTVRVSSVRVHANGVVVRRAVASSPASVAGVSATLLAVAALTAWLRRDALEEAWSRTLLIANQEVAALVWLVVVVIALRVFVRRFFRR